ncbi:MAG: hypothetical protein L6V88_07155 [Anaerotruncus sp.]|nr:MAG: hypothetical protein L6V88_07155 [Anaerotruncus sp.]
MRPPSATKMFADYKAGRHAMPDELRSQMPMIKEILKKASESKTLECEGWEADDILGTLAQKCRENGDLCFIATGDRDSLQLAHGGVTVLLAHTKAGKAVTDPYDEAAIEAEYGVTPQELIQVKALQGDSSDNIPGVAGSRREKRPFRLFTIIIILIIFTSTSMSLKLSRACVKKLRRDKEKKHIFRLISAQSEQTPLLIQMQPIMCLPKKSADAARLFAKYELFSLMDKFELNINDAHEPEPEKGKQKYNQKRGRLFKPRIRRQSIFLLRRFGK